MIKGETMSEISRTIHYCWFGGNPLPNTAKKCIASWKKYFPEYEVKEWNENNFDIHCCKYVEEAYEQKKWAFVSDYARFWILYNYGGMYFDTDVEVVKNFQALIDKGPFMGCELAEANDTSVAPGLGLAANPGLGLYKEILNYYDNLNFEYKEGNVETVVAHTTRILKIKGFNGTGNIEYVDGIYIYPPEYFCPMNQFTGKTTITNNTCSIHHYTASWQSGYSRFKTKLQQILGPSVTKTIIKLKNRIKHNLRE